MRVKKKDLNQSDIESELKTLGLSVQSLHTLGQGVPDLLVGVMNLNYIVEVKHDDAPLTPSEIEWHKSWNGQVRVAQSSKEIILALAAYAQAMKRKLDAVTEFCDGVLIRMEEEDGNTKSSGGN